MSTESAESATQTVPAERLAAAAAVVAELAAEVTDRYGITDALITTARAGWKGSAAGHFARHHMVLSERATALRAALDRVHTTLASI